MKVEIILVTRLVKANEQQHVIFNQCGILPSVDSDKHVQPLVKLRNSKFCSASSFRVLEYASD